MDWEEVITSAARGDDETFLQVISAYKADLYKTALAYLKDEDEALEAVQEVTYRAYKKRHTLKEPAYIKTWLIRIMINHCNDQLRRRKRVVPHGEVVEIRGVSDDHTKIELGDAIERLDMRSREILMLKYFHDMQIDEIAGVMGSPEGTVKTWLHKALKRLRSKMEAGGDADV